MTDGHRAGGSEPVKGPGEEMAQFCDVFFALNPLETGGAATIDSALPMFDPFSDYYNENTPGIEVSQEIGGPSL